MFTLKKSESFWWAVNFDWVNEDGDIEQHSIRFRFKRTSIAEFRKALADLEVKRKELDSDSQSTFIPDRELMLGLIDDLEAGVVVEGSSDTKSKISRLLEYNAILSAALNGYQDAVLRGGQSRDALKK